MQKLQSIKRKDLYRHTQGGENSTMEKISRDKVQLESLPEVQPQHEALAPYATFSSRESQIF